MNLIKLSKECQQAAVNAGFESERRSFGDLISLMHSELSEALEEFRAGRAYDEIYYNCPRREEHQFHTNSCKPEGIPIELADTIIRILQFCGYANINIEEAIRLKMAYNETRPWKHGGKAI